MYEESELDTTLFDFDEISDHLLEQGALQSPSQIHGCLSGLLAAGAETEGEYGLDALAQSLDLAAHGELADELMRLYQVTGISIRDDEFTYDLLLPDDETELEIRVEALGAWCSGFLTGVAHISGRAGQVWSADSKEILEDITAMSQIAIGDGETEEESEDSYIEIIEYLRCAVLNLFFENEAQSSFSSLSREPDEPLH